MRKNKVNFKNLKIYTRYEVEGRNIHALINILNKRQIEIKNLKVKAKNKIYISVPLKDDKKFFAILNELCYNVKKVKMHGIGYPFFYFSKNPGLLLGGLFFIFSACFFNNFIFDFSFTGSGSIYEKEIREKLKNDGIEKYKNFSSFNLREEAENILKDNENLVFISLEKRGNYLIVNSTKKEEDTKIKQEKKILYSSCNGVVEDVKVYCGTQLKSVNETVKKGEILAVGKEYDNYQGNVIAIFSILSEFNFSFESENDNEEDFAIILAKETLNKETVFESVKKTKKDKKYIYSVLLKYRVIIS